jgi:very-short-patch-repair endonuclease
MRESIVKYKPYLKQLSRDLRNNSTLSEVLLWNKLKKKQMRGYTFLRQKPVDNFILDFYCKELKLALEIDGSSHIGKEEADLIRQKKIESFGISFLRFSDLEVKKHINGVLRSISKFIDEFEKVKSIENKKSELELITLPTDSPFQSDIEGDSSSSKLNSNSLPTGSPFKSDIECNSSSSKLNSNSLPNSSPFKSDIEGNSSFSKLNSKPLPTGSPFKSDIEGNSNYSKLNSNSLPTSSPFKSDIEGNSNYSKLNSNSLPTSSHFKSDIECNSSSSKLNSNSLPNSSPFKSDIEGNSSFSKLNSNSLPNSSPFQSDIEGNSSFSKLNSKPIPTSSPFQSDIECNSSSSKLNSNSLPTGSPFKGGMGVVLLLLSLTQICFASDDKCFNDSENNHICIGHPKRSEVNFTIDKTTQKITAKTQVNFQVNTNANKAFFLFDPQVNKALLNGKEISVEKSKTPNNEDNIIVFPVNNNERISESNQILELEYEVTNLTKWGLNWSPFSWLTDYSDSIDARYINVFAPASFEEDRYPMSYNFNFKGFEEKISLYTSASKIVQPEKYTYNLLFANWTNVASPYFEFTTKEYISNNYIYRGKYQPIPVTVYFSPDIILEKKLSIKALMDKSKASINKTLSYFENTMGEYAFDKLLVKIYSLQEGELPLSQEYSMEFGGAVVSRLELVPHELCHQWFGRGASPKDGQAGFIDELVCDWYDYNNPIKKPIERKATLLSTNNLWTLRTPEESYQEGVFLAELSYMFKEKNLSLYTFFSDFYNEFRLSSYSVDDFTTMLDKRYPNKLQPYFKKYIKGNN